MKKLTRTDKYKDLRNQININKESETKEELPKYTFEDFNLNNKQENNIEKIYEDIFPTLDENITKVETTKTQTSLDSVTEEKDVVEIKNIDETEFSIEKTNNNTIIIQDQDTDEYEEIKESNIFLNTILVILILVLISILGGVVYYMLKVKGII